MTGQTGYAVDTTASCGHRVVIEGFEAPSRDEAVARLHSRPCAACAARGALLEAEGRGEVTEALVVEWAAALLCESRLAGDDRLARLMDAVRTIV